VPSPRTTRLATTGFYDRRATRKDDLFLAPEEIRLRSGAFASSFLENATGFQVLRKHNKRRVVSKRSGCEPGIFIDGQFIRTGLDRNGLDLGTLDELVPSGDVFALEAYRRAPAEFQPRLEPGQPDCGAVVVWTRRYAG